MVRRLFILAAALLAMQTALPQMKRPEPPRAEFFTPDSARMRTSPSERTERLYDSIRSKTSRRAVPRMLYGLLFTRSRIDTTRSGAVEDESQRFLPYEGRTIGSVTIERNQVFDPDGNWLERTGNNLHILTRERVLRHVRALEARRPAQGRGEGGESVRHHGARDGDRRDRRALLRPRDARDGAPRRDGGGAVHRLHARRGGPRRHGALGRPR